MNDKDTKKSENRNITDTDKKKTESKRVFSRRRNRRATIEKLKKRLSHLPPEIAGEIIKSKVKLLTTFQPKTHRRSRHGLSIKTKGRPVSMQHLILSENKENEVIEKFSKLLQINKQIVEKAKAGIAEAFDKSKENSSSITYREGDDILTVIKAGGYGKEVIERKKARPLIEVESKTITFKL